MKFVEVEHLYKSFGDATVVNDLSFSVESGEIFGLLGPNGAGKTTTIRILLDIYQSDRGTTKVFGSKINPSARDRIGYLPEERGLYQDVSLEHCLIYLARLKGLNKQETNERLNRYLDRFDLSAHRKKKIKALSKGMQQKAQLIATLIHEPDLIIIDEPFTALDPVNTQMVKTILKEQRDLGKTVIMCTHQMHQVEELCDRMLLIDHGQRMLYGSLMDIRRQFSGKEVLVQTLEPMPDGSALIQHQSKRGNASLIELVDTASPQDLLRELLNHNLTIERFEQ
ncbi:MAG: ATP-binding cassette domain-containing protein, partial [Anaerolineaceae bacterium]|nr:ATP-binding cassette domain-containing protein [Anaerolineaceae bacterium]